MININSNDIHKYLKIEKHKDLKEQLIDIVVQVVSHQYEFASKSNYKLFKMTKSCFKSKQNEISIYHPRLPNLHI